MEPYYSNLRQPMHQYLPPMASVDYRFKRGGGSAGRIIKTLHDRVYDDTLTATEASIDHDRRIMRSNSYRGTNRIQMPPIPSLPPQDHATPFAMHQNSHSRSLARSTHSLNYDQEDSRMKALEAAVLNKMDNISKLEQRLKINEMVRDQDISGMVESGSRERSKLERNDS